MRMRVLVTGVTGQLGHDCVLELKDRGIEVQGVSSREFPLTDAEAMRRYMAIYKPTCVIHCAAYTAVDRAEDEEAACMAVNAAGTANLAKLCREFRAKMVYISTDYVFPGDGTEPYETDAPKGPTNVYGKSKLMGEEAAAAMLAEQLKRKEAGAKYCNCPSCTAASELLAKFGRIEL